MTVYKRTISISGIIEIKSNDLFLFLADKAITIRINIHQNGKPTLMMIETNGIARMVSKIVCMWIRILLGKIGPYFEYQVVIRKFPYLGKAFKNKELFAPERPKNGFKYLLFAAKYTSIR